MSLESYIPPRSPVSPSPVSKWVPSEFCHDAGPFEDRPGSPLVDATLPPSRISPTIDGDGPMHPSEAPLRPAEPAHTGPHCQVTTVISTQHDALKPLAALGLAFYTDPCPPKDGEVVNWAAAAAEDDGAHDGELRSANPTNFLRVAAVSEGSAAAAAGGVQKDDRLLQINGRSVGHLTHTAVLEMLTAAASEGSLKLVLDRPVVHHGPPPLPAAVVRRGRGSLTTALAQPVRRGICCGDSTIRTRVGAAKAAIRLHHSVAGSQFITLHRHPVSKGFSVGLAGGYEKNRFPSVKVATHPRSPWLPLVEGGELHDGDELLEIDGVCCVGRRLSDVIEMLQESGEEVVLRVIAPARGLSGPRTLSKLLANDNLDSATLRYAEQVRRALSEWLLLATTREPVNGQVNGVDYVFLDGPSFARKAAAGKFLEWVELRDSVYYGWPKASSVQPGGKMTRTSTRSGSMLRSTPPLLSGSMEELHLAHEIAVLHPPPTPSTSPSSLNVDHIGEDTVEANFCVCDERGSITVKRHLTFECSDSPPPSIDSSSDAKMTDDQLIQRPISATVFKPLNPASSRTADKLLLPVKTSVYRSPLTPTKAAISSSTPHLCHSIEL